MAGREVGTLAVSVEQKDACSIQGQETERRVSMVMARKRGLLRTLS
jgi:hypothetical protein